MIENKIKTEGIKAVGSKIIKACELIKIVENEPRPEFLWNGIVKGSKGLIVGIGKTGKTTMAENLALCLAVGREEYLGYSLSGIPQKVLFINLEESHTIRTWRTMEQIKMLSEDELKLFEDNYISTPPDFPQFLNTDSDWELLSDYIKKSEAEICFIDSLSHMLLGEIERSKVCSDFTQKYRYYIGSLNKTIILIHHNTKSNNEKPIGMSSIAGSRYITQEFEYAIGLSAIPNNGEMSYLCNIFNKYQKNNITQAKHYSINEFNWLELEGESTIQEIYGNKINKIDRRKDTTNRDRIYQFIVDRTNELLNSMDSMGNTVNTDIVVLTKEILSHFLNKIPRQTVFDSLGKLVEENKLVTTTGKYMLPNNVSNV